LSRHASKNQQAGMFVFNGLKARNQHFIDKFYPKDNVYGLPV
jgi:hypothetical protein